MSGNYRIVIIELSAKKSIRKKEEVYLNTRCPMGVRLFEEKIKKIDVDCLFMDVAEMENDYKKLSKLWNNTLKNSFKKVRRSKNKVKGLDYHVKKLLKEEREVKNKWNDV